VKSNITLQKISCKENKCTYFRQVSHTCGNCTKARRLKIGKIVKNFEKYSKKVLQKDYNIVTI